MALWPRVRPGLVANGEMPVSHGDSEARRGRVNGPAGIRVSVLDARTGAPYTCGMTTSTLTRKNQITLPDEIVRALDLAPGSQLAWSIGPDGTLIGTPQPDRAQRAAAAYGAGRRFLHPGDDPVRDLIAERLADDDAYRTEE